MSSNSKEHDGVAGGADPRGRDGSLEDKLGSLQRQAALGQIAAQIAHELSTPLTTIAGHAEELLRQASHGDHKTRLEAINRAVERSQTIIKHTLGLVREGASSPGPVDLNEVVAALVSLKSYSIADRALVFSTDLAESLPLVRADFNRLLQVALNLVANAERAVRSVDGAHEVTVFTRLADGRAQFGVRDTGPGIPEDLHCRIFEPLFTTFAAEGGVGIGLWVSRSIIEDYGGVIHVSSEPGEGTTFTVQLPAAPEDSQ